MNSCSLQVFPSISFEKQTKSSNQHSVHSKLFVSSMESVREWDPKIKLAEESKLCPVKGGRKMPDLSTLNISKYDAQTGFHLLQCFPVRKFSDELLNDHLSLDIGLLEPTKFHQLLHLIKILNHFRIQSKTYKYKALEHQRLLLLLLALRRNCH